MTVQELVSGKGRTDIRDLKSEQAIEPRIQIWIGHRFDQFMRERGRRSVNDPMRSLAWDLTPRYGLVWLD